MNEQVKKTKLHYAWIVLIGCCALTSGMGLLLNTGGQWFVAVTTELGASATELALYFTVCGLCMSATAPFVGKFLPKANVRILLTVCYVLCIAAVFAMSLYNAVWQWWISGAVLGIAGCFVFLIPTPVILGNWFAKKTGFAIGIAMSFSGISAAIANPIIAILIADIGWRFAYSAIAIVSAIIILPCTLFLIRYKPEDKQLLPYGAEEVVGAAVSDAPTVAQEGVPAKKAYKSFPFWILFICGGLIAFLTGFSQVLPMHMSLIGMTTIIGLISTLAMVGNFIGMLGLGAISDKIGGAKTAVIGLGAVLAGFLLLIFSGQSAIIALAGALLYGVALSLVAVIVPILCREAFGGKDFASLYSSMNVAVSLIGAFGIAVITLIYDATKSYLPSFWVGIAGCIFIILGVIVSMGMAKRLPRE